MCMCNRFMWYWHATLCPLHIAKLSGIDVPRRIVRSTRPVTHFNWFVCAAFIQLLSGSHICPFMGIEHPFVWSRERAFLDLWVFLWAQFMGLHMGEWTLSHVGVRETHTWRDPWTMSQVVFYVESQAIPMKLVNGCVALTIWCSASISVSVAILYGHSILEGDYPLWVFPVCFFPFR